jgi:hypothetical protein
MIAPESLFLGSSTDGCAHAVPAGAPLAWRRKGRAHNFTVNVREVSVVVVNKARSLVLAAIGCDEERGWARPIPAPPRAAGKQRRREIGSPSCLSNDFLREKRTLGKLARPFVERRDLSRRAGRQRGHSCAANEEWICLPSKRVAERSARREDRCSCVDGSVVLPV